MASRHGPWPLAYWSRSISRVRASLYVAVTGRAPAETVTPAWVLAMPMCAEIVTWPSGGIQSYLDQRVHYNQGDYDSEFKRIFSPLYFLTDAVEAVVRAPVAWAESFSWVELGDRPAVNEIGDLIGCERTRWRRFERTSSLAARASCRGCRMVMTWRRP